MALARSVGPDASDERASHNQAPASKQAAQASERWAAIDPNNEGSAPVVWDGTKAGARQKAIDACKRVSKTCAGDPANTDVINDTFAYMCCQQPRLGCAIGVGERREDALAMVQKTFAEAGFSQCTLRSYISAKTGAKTK